MREEEKREGERQDREEGQGEKVNYCYPSLWPQRALLFLDSNDISWQRSSLSIQIKLLLKVLRSPKEKSNTKQDNLSSRISPAMFSKISSVGVSLMWPLWLQIKVKIFSHYSVRPTSPSQSPDSQRYRLKRNRLSPCLRAASSKLGESMSSQNSDLFHR